MSPSADRGQATVEVALLLPVLVVAAAALLHIGSAAASLVRLEHAAREGARAAAVEPDRARSVATEAVRAVVDDTAVHVEVVVEPETVSVSVSRPLALVPLVPGSFTRTLQADVVMRREDLFD